MMRAATLFNFLIEAMLTGSVMILLLLVVRRLLRRQLGNRLICLAWLLVAVRLLLPLSFPNPMMNELRPTYSDNLGVRPIADQVRVRSHDALSGLAEAMGGGNVRGTAASRAVFEFAAESSYGHTARYVAMLYGGAALCVLAVIAVRNAAFLRRLKRERVGPLTGDQLALYHKLCNEHNVKPLPVYWVDPLPGACLAGVLRPWIALPLSLRPEALGQALMHELCHQKARDPWWNLMRGLCCAVHWFNPLVWLAASLSRMDCEMACDDRVTARMDGDERLAYAGTLALAAAPKSEPGLTALSTGMTMKGARTKQRVKSIVERAQNVRWLSICALAVAGIGFLFSFATAEYILPVTLPAIPVISGEAASPTAIRGVEDAAAYARRLLSGLPLRPDVNLMRIEAYQLERDDVTHHDGSWWVEAYPEGGDAPYTLQFSSEGTVYLYWDNTNQHDERPTRARTQDTLQDDPTKNAPLLAHARDFARVMLPGVGPLDPLYVDRDTEMADGCHYVSLRYGGYETPDDGSAARFIGGAFYMQVLPEVRILHYSVMD